MGYSNNMIANVIKKEEQTVAQYKTNIRKKLGIESGGNIASFINEGLMSERKRHQS
jgi:DNA-binding NarL/FixJ family response regulator